MIQYKDLSVPLKIAVIFAWVCGLITLFSFGVGFIAGVLGL